MELQHLSVLQEVRAFTDPLDKAVYILRNYSGDIKLTKRGISSYWKFEKKRLKKRLWTTLLGHDVPPNTKLPYLAPKHEADLSELIDLSNKKLDSKTYDEVMNMVSKKGLLTIGLISN